MIITPHNNNNGLFMDLLLLQHFHKNITIAAAARTAMTMTTKMTTTPMGIDRLEYPFWLCGILRPPSASAVTSADQKNAEIEHNYVLLIFTHAHICLHTHTKRHYTHTFIPAYYMYVLEKIILATTVHLPAHIRTTKKKNKQA